MKIAVRCIYHLPVTPNFLIIDWKTEEFQKFLAADRLQRIAMARPYINQPGPSEIREISWISLEGLKERELMELEAECEKLKRKGRSDV